MKYSDLCVNTIYRTSKTNIFYKVISLTSNYGIVLRYEHYAYCSPKTCTGTLEFINVYDDCFYDWKMIDKDDLDDKYLSMRIDQLRYRDKNVAIFY